VTRSISIGSARIGKGAPLLVIMGPCVIEDEASAFEAAGHIKRLSLDLGIPMVFKASYDKANRTSIQSFRGPGLREGLRILGRIRAEWDLPVLSDVHRISEVAHAAEVLDVLQIPAFLCRQTDLIVEAARTGKPLNIKKGQFMAPEDMAHVVRKAESTGNERILITERGTSFGYQRLVVDLTGLKVMRDMGYPVVFDATHSVQRPGAGDGCSGGRNEFIPLLARGAVAAGVDGLFFEVHPHPESALCDGANSLPMKDVPRVLQTLLRIHKVVHEQAF